MVRRGGDRLRTYCCVKTGLQSEVSTAVELINYTHNIMYNERDMFWSNSIQLVCAFKFHNNQIMSYRKPKELGNSL